MQPGFLLYLIKMSWPLNFDSSSTATVCPASLAVCLSGSAGWMEGAGLPLHTLFHVNIFIF